jgi:hypothetical protein
VYTYALHTHTHTFTHTHTHTHTHTITRISPRRRLHVPLHDRVAIAAAHVNNNTVSGAELRIALMLHILKIAGTQKFDMKLLHSPAFP